MNPYTRLARLLSETIPVSRIYRDEPSLFAYGTDASFYRLTPRLAVRVESAGEVMHVLRACRQAGTSCTFRAAGTSLSGQAVTDSVLVMLGNGWDSVSVASGGGTITLGPGVIGARANESLRPWMRKIGPDPASIHAAMIGGIAANNASGMCCGTEATCYKTLVSLKAVLADGTLLDTGDPRSREIFQKSHTGFLSGLSGLAARVKDNPALAERIKKKYSIKNTTGYSLNSLLDFQDPFEIFQHLLIGSEGTLAFISEITLRTVADPPFKAAALVFFENVETACRAVAALPSGLVSAAELMDDASLRSVQGKPGMPPEIETIRKGMAALLVEVRADSRAELLDSISRLEAALAPYAAQKADFTEDAAVQHLFWKVRKGLFPSVGAMREAGTTVIIEDVCFPVMRLGEAVRGLRQLLIDHGYEAAIVFGHALQGNLHFVFTPDFNVEEQVRRYGAFMEALAQWVTAEFDGSLKAEHGTGRNMAPFVEREWGSEAYALMGEIKHLFDPEYILNPGVILNPDAGIHLKNLKPMAAVDPLVDRCTECGFCEPVCPSRRLTLTPRQRIAVLRETSRREAAGVKNAGIFRNFFNYAGEKTCAADGLCAAACPVSIDTGSLIKKIRSRTAAPLFRTAAAWAARHFEFFLSLIRLFLSVARFAGFPGPARAFKGREGNSDRTWSAVYAPGCLSRTFGCGKDDRENLVETTVALIEKAGGRVVFPEGMAGLCCGLAFESKGFPEAGQAKAREMSRALRAASHGGEFPVLMDTAPCLHRMNEFLGPDSGIRLMGPEGFLLEHLKERLLFSPLNGTVALHPVCSSLKMNSEQSLREAASLCAEKVVLTDAGCCGAAGDKGIRLPELAASALQDLKHKLPRDCRSGCSTSLMCEKVLSRHAGLLFEPLFVLAGRVSRPRGIPAQVAAAVPAQKELL